MPEIAILGATGYAGTELIRLLFNHPGARLSFFSSESHAGSSLDRTLPQFYGLLKQKLHPLQVDAVPEAVELVFCALPHGSSATVVPALLSKGKKVIDLSADFRLRDPLLYDRWYGRAHPAAELLEETVYGLPEINGTAVQSARLVANPGCYPTGALLALAPLAREGLVTKGSVIVDAKSGVSGAGRAPKPEFHFPDCTENFKAYRVGNHQHIPEIEQELGRLAGEEVRITFTPHLVPMIRGILSTVYLSLKMELSQDWLDSLYRDFYARHSFVRVLEPPLLPETRLVRGSNYCDLAVRCDTRTGRLVIISAIDNLVKGAAGQAVQNMNLMYGYPEETGLTLLPV
jgi:N-acetyl-gamma-glutamyl-phosphate reductase